MKAKFLLVVTLLIMSIGPSSWAKEGVSKGNTKVKGGWTESYGGNAEVAEFKNIIRQVFYLTNEFSIEDFQVNYKFTSEVLDNLKIECKLNLTINGVAKDAINFPYQLPQLVLIDCEKWRTFNQNAKLSLTIHEFLPLLGILDGSYKFSSLLIKEYQKRKSYVSEESKNLIESSKNCDLKGIQTALEEGANPYAEELSGFGIRYNPLDWAINMDCDLSVIKGLLNSVVGYSYNPQKFKNVEDRPDYKLIGSLISEFITRSHLSSWKNELRQALTLEELNSSIQILSLLVDTAKDSSTFYSQGSYSYMLDNLDNKGTLYLCSESAREKREVYVEDLLWGHFIKDYDIKDGFYKDALSLYLKELIELGYFSDKENFCGENIYHKLKEKGLL